LAGRRYRRGRRYPTFHVLPNDWRDGGFDIAPGKPEQPCSAILARSRGVADDCGRRRRYISEDGRDALLDGERDFSLSIPTAIRELFTVSVVHETVEAAASGGIVSVVRAG